MCPSLHDADLSLSVHSSVSGTMIRTGSGIAKDAAPRNAWFVASALTSVHFADMLDFWTARELVPTHFIDYALHPSLDDVFLVNPYASPP